MKSSFAHFHFFFNISSYSSISRISCSIFPACPSLPFRLPFFTIQLAESSCNFYSELLVSECFVLWQGLLMHCNEMHISFKCIASSACNVMFSVILFSNFLLKTYFPISGMLFYVQGYATGQVDNCPLVSPPQWQGTLVKSEEDIAASSG